MALPLITLNYIDTSTRPYYEMSMSGDARPILEANFPGAFTPVLFVRLTDTRMANPLPAEFFDAEVGDSLLVWPTPVVIQGKTLLLMKMWFFDVTEEDEIIRNVVQRALTTFLSVSTHCVVCFEHSLKFKGLRFLQRLYVELQRKGLQIIKFVVLSQNVKTNQSYQSQEDEYKKIPESLFTIFVRSTEWGNPDIFFHHLLSETDGRVFPSIGNWIDNLNAAMRFANTFLNGKSFVRNFSPFDIHQFPQYEETILKFEKEQRMLRLASVRNFIVRGNGNICRLDDSIIDILRMNFDRNKPTVVLTLIGMPGLGKSTFLNYLIQHAFQRLFLDEYFKTGSSQTHTTRDSWMFSCPLPLPNPEYQMLLIDLEGLGGFETINERERIMQYNLVSGVLAVSSVPCIFVPPDLAHQRIVEGYISRLVNLSKELGFVYNKIHFLFNDKDFRRDEESDNIQMLEWIARLNKKAFGNRSVITLISKPNFVDPKNAAMISEFLDTFLADCNHPKLNSSQTYLTIAEMLDQIKYIALRPTTDLSQVPSDLESIGMIRAKKEELEKLTNEITSDGTVSLITLFNEKYRAYIGKLRNERYDEAQPSHLELSLESKARELRQNLLWTEADLVFFSEWRSDEEIIAQVSSRVQDYYANSLWIGTFMEQCEKLRKRLDSVAKHYPTQQSRVATGIGSLITNRESSKRWYIGHYAAQGILAGATLGLSAAAASTYYTAVTLRSVILATRIGYVAGAFGGATLAKITTFLGFKQLLTPTANTLFIVLPNDDPALETNSYLSRLWKRMKKRRRGGGERIVWIDDSLRLFTTTSDKCIVLVIARHSMGVANVLNSFIDDTTQLSSSSNKFQDGKSAQVISFPFPSRNAEGIILFLAFNGSSVDTAVNFIMRAIFGLVSICCIFEDQDDTFVENLLLNASGEIVSQRAQICLVLKRSLSTGFKEKFRFAMRNTHHVMFDADTQNPEEQRVFKLMLSQCMIEACVLERNEAEDVIHRAQQSVEGFGLR